MDNKALREKNTGEITFMQSNKEEKENAKIFPREYKSTKTKK